MLPATDHMREVLPATYNLWELAESAALLASAGPAGFRGAKKSHYSILPLSGTLKGPRKSVLLSGRPTYPNLLISKIFAK